MPERKERLLIVDDEPSIRLSMAHVLTAIGYEVQSAEDGLSALAALRKEVPDILLADLIMPGMSGHELLSVIRRRFPSIQVIAMSGAFSGDEVPSGVAADAFYQKGSSVGSLLKLLGALPKGKSGHKRSPREGAPIWIQHSGPVAGAETSVTISCPECLRTFRQAIGSSINLVLETDCQYCRSRIRYAIVQPAKRPPLQILQRTSPDERSATAAPQYYH